MGKLEKHDWPGNIRELENIIERALIQCGGGPLRFEGLSSFLKKDLFFGNGDQEVKPLKLDEMNSMYISRILKLMKGKISGPGGSAEILGIHPSTLRKKMDKLGITYRRRQYRVRKKKISML